MVYFKDNSSSSNEHYLIILEDQNQPMEKGTMLAVYAPLVGGRNVSPWPRLTNFFYLDEWSREVSLSKSVKAWTLRATYHELPRHQQLNNLAPLCTLGRSIVEGDEKWDDDLQFIGEFHYTKDIGSGLRMCLASEGRNYSSSKHMMLFTLRGLLMITIPRHHQGVCEAWCPLTNTLLTFVGELSISFWDLHDLAGLSMTGCLYDEVVPSALELIGADEKGGRFIPRSNKYLLYAYHLLQSVDGNQCSSVSIDQWVKFWSKKAMNTTSFLLVKRKNGPA
ncbi:UNVERIFIED_CONTAM: hypothetical protein Sradi_5700900 [Sesamum radiatum]|uniref:Uncharacterized protein n=1 Tax=Sesamum radiatum TaxID=300843 RepID=A0AAW2L589_SESRA